MGFALVITPKDNQRGIYFLTELWFYISLLLIDCTSTVTRRFRIPHGLRIRPPTSTNRYRSSSKQCSIPFLNSGTKKEAVRPLGENA
jgi:hypothetical protein